MGPRPAFVVFGIPVVVDWWFFLGLFLFYQLSGGGRPGLFTAIAVGVFTLIHELGHALVARRFGGENIHISLNMFVGWASYAGGHRMARWQRNLVSLAGPVTELVVAAATIGVVRAVMPLDQIATPQDLQLHFDLINAIAWAGIIIAGLNLLPLWPLDGGHVFDSLVARRFGLAGTKWFLQFTLVASAVMLVGSVMSRGSTNDLLDWINRQRGLAFTESLPLTVGRLLLTVPALAVSSAGFIAIFTGLSSWQALQQLQALRVQGEAAPSRRALADEATQREARTAERHGWTGVAATPYPKGWGPSPWLEAHVARQRGAAPDELARLLARLGRPADGWLVDDLSRPEVGALLPFVPPEVDTSPNVVAARVHHGPPDDLVSTALATYRGPEEPEAFYVIAEGMAERGLLDDAMSWLTGAVERKPDPRRVATSRHLQVLHGRSDYQQLLGVAERAVAPPRG